MSEQEGQLFVMSTPIGNLEDMTYRAVRVLQEADLVAAEDTRRAQKLLNHFEIKVKTISYHAHNEHHKTSQIIDQVEYGKKVVIISDAGTPCIADPGFLGVREAVKRGIEPIVIPGVSALTFAAVAVGLPVDKFSFYGFLPVKKGRRTTALEQIQQEGKTCFVYESPYRMEKLLNIINEVMGPQTLVAVVREATKMYEEVLRGTAAELVEMTAGRSWKGECVVAIHPVASDEE